MQVDSVLDHRENWNYPGAKWQVERQTLAHSLEGILWQAEKWQLQTWSGYRKVQVKGHLAEILETRTAQVYHLSPWKPVDENWKSHINFK